MCCTSCSQGYNKIYCMVRAQKQPEEKRLGLAFLLFRNNFAEAFGFHRLFAVTAT